MAPGTSPLPDLAPGIPTARVVRVLVATPAPLFRCALRTALNCESDLSVGAELGDSDTTLRLVQQLVPDIAMIDSDLPRAGGIATCAAIKAANLPTRVLIIGERPDRAELLAAIEAGADGYLTKASDVDEIAAALRQLHSGHACVPPEMLNVLLRDLIERRRAGGAALERFARLSRREREVLALLAEGLDHNDIAAKLFVSAHTARTHIQNLLEKLEVHSRVEAVGLALEHDIISRSPHALHQEVQ